MDGWINEVDGWVDGWMNEVDGWVDGWMERRMGGWIEK